MTDDENLEFDANRPTTRLGHGEPVDLYTSDEYATSLEEWTRRVAISLTGPNRGRTSVVNPISKIDL